MARQLMERLLPNASTTAGTRLPIALAVLVFITICGTAGYMWIEGMSLLEALYMSTITLSTVGYGEVSPLSSKGQAFTIVFIALGVGSAIYTVAALAEFFIEGRMREALGRKAMERAIQAMRDHVIVCGYGRLGREVTLALRSGATSVVVIEANPEREADLEELDVPYVIGSAVEEGVLEKAGIQSAAAVVCATPSDPDNVYIALSARELNPGIAVHARGETEHGARRMRLAGADQVISIHRLAGRRIANAILRPAVVDFIELADPGGDAPIDLEEIELGSGCRLEYTAVHDLVDHGLEIQVVAIRRPGQATLLNPAPEYVIKAGDHIVVVGDHDHLQRLATLAEAASEGASATR